mgnify:FL=1
MPSPLEYRGVREGATKYPPSIVIPGEPPLWNAKLDLARRLMLERDWMGRYPNGVGKGNVGIVEFDGSITITASQIQDQPVWTRKNYVNVVVANTYEERSIYVGRDAYGERPSSELFTYQAMAEAILKEYKELARGDPDFTVDLEDQLDVLSSIYRLCGLDPAKAAYSQSGMLAIVHPHDTKLWKLASKLGIPETKTTARYGTRRFGEAVQRRVKPQGIIGALATPTHEDGVFSWAPLLN